MPGVQIGLRDLHYALLTQDDTNGIAYDGPVKMIGAVQANINPNASLETLFADDGPMETAASMGQITLEMIASDFPLDVQAVLLGHTIVNGRLVRKAGDVPPWLAIGFKSLKSNGKYRFVWLLKGKFQLPEQNHETKGDSVNFQTPTLTGSFVKRDYDDEWIHQTDEDMASYTSDIGTNWFTSVIPNADVTAPVVSSVTPVDAAASVAVDTTVQWTFSEAIQPGDVTSGNFFVLDDLNSQVAGSLTISEDKTIVTFTPSSNLANSTTFTAYVTTNVKDLAGNHLADAHVTSFTTTA